MDNYKPFVLQQNKRYSSYQLYAIAGTSSSDKETIFKKCVLHTYEWLRAKSQVPINEFDYPKPADSDSVSLSDFKHVSINVPYSIEIETIPEKKIWTLRLTEQDSGENGKRKPVVGRTFETNIGYIESEQGIECGFKTIISEPDDTTDKVESYRLGCIKNIARDPNIGLYQGFQLLDKPIYIDDQNSARKLVRWIKSEDRKMPVIIADTNLPDFKGTIYNRAINFDNLINNEIHKIPTTINKEYLCNNENTFNIDVESLARYKMGYVQYFVPSKEMSNYLDKELGNAYDYCRINIYEPDGTARAFHLDQSGLEKKLEAYAMESPSKTIMGFGNVCFVPDARDILLQEKIAEAKNVNEICQSYEERISGLNAKHEEKIKLYKDKVDELTRVINKKDDELTKFKEESNRHIDNKEISHNEEIENLKEEISKLNKELSIYKSKERRPNSLSKIQSWVNDEFANRLILHEKAIGLLSELKDGDWDIELICDALEFLATDYYDNMIGIISEDEMKNNCARKYHRPFDVTPLTLPPIQGTPKEYKIKYYIGAKGKPVDSPLDLHLRIGVDSEKLIRIYFLYDKNKKLIVVGSLPKHLPKIM